MNSAAKVLYKVDGRRTVRRGLDENADIAVVTKAYKSKTSRERDVLDSGFWTCVQFRDFLCAFTLGFDIRLRGRKLLKQRKKPLYAEAEPCEPKLQPASPISTHTGHDEATATWPSERRAPEGTPAGRGLGLHWVFSL